SIWIFFPFLPHSQWGFIIPNSTRKNFGSSWENAPCIDRVFQTSIRRNTPRLSRRSLSSRAEDIFVTTFSLKAGRLALRTLSRSRSIGRFEKTWLRGAESAVARSFTSRRLFTAERVTRFHSRTQP